MARPTCRGCGAIIRWIRTVNNKAMPVDPERLTEWIDTDAPSDATPRISLVTADGHMIVGKQGSVLAPGCQQFQGYTPHWATCPQRERFKKEKP